MSEQVACSTLQTALTSVGLYCKSQHSLIVIHLNMSSMTHGHTLQYMLRDGNELHGKLAAAPGSRSSMQANLSDPTSARRCRYSTSKGRLHPLVSARNAARFFYCVKQRGPQRLLTYQPVHAVEHCTATRVTLSDACSFLAPGKAHSEIEQAPTSVVGCCLSARAHQTASIVISTGCCPLCNHVEQRCLRRLLNCKP